MPLGISDAVELTGTISDLVKKGLTLELQERITQLREAVLNAKDEVLALRDETQSLKVKVQERDAWGARAAKYTLITAPGGAHVYQTSGPPEHFACPRCFEERRIHILQDIGVSSGVYRCPGCEKQFAVGGRERWSPPRLRPLGQVDLARTSAAASQESSRLLPRLLVAPEFT